MTARYFPLYISYFFFNYLKYFDLFRVVAGTFDKKVVQLDLREQTGKMTYFLSHKKPVLKVKITPTRILSLSEDSVLSVHDRRAGRRLKKVVIPSPPPSFGAPLNSFPLSMDLLDNMLYVGDRNVLFTFCGEKKE